MRFYSSVHPSLSAVAAGEAKSPDISSSFKGIPRLYPAQIGHVIPPESSGFGSGVGRSSPGGEFKEYPPEGGVWETS